MIDAIPFHGGSKFLLNINSAPGLYISRQTTLLTQRRIYPVDQVAIIPTATRCAVFPFSVSQI
ncbi:hypothetical protein [Streptomyces sp. NPDC046909]|uniref:hypothetical protein n=1 Tax=Streptomyces sp. NPDC046909 TaxID=3155617 RepID=UPI003401284D